MLPKPEESPITAFLTVWDEQTGAHIIDAYPANGFDFEIISMNIFQSFQTVFGNNPDIRFDKTPLTLPLKSHSRMAKILLDSKPNPKVRGGYLPFFVVFMLPIDFPEEYITKYAGIQEAILKAFQQNNSVKLQNYTQEINQIAESVAKELWKTSESLIREKNTEMAIKRTYQALAIAIAIKNRNLSHQYHQALNKLRTRRALELIETGKMWVKRGDTEKPVELIDQAMELAKLTQDLKIIKSITKELVRLGQMVADLFLQKGKEAETNGLAENFCTSEKYYRSATDLADHLADKTLIKKYTKVMREGYQRWAIIYLDRGIGAIKRSDLREAHHILSEALRFAKPTLNTRLINKIHDQLGKVPNP
jgi:hypothetical protein